ncbi:MAG: endonuclease domain-containing protein [Sphingomonadales bacterium]|nr:endonuclease domain-containing protein [Sphingomonadales bacterium]
MGGRGRALARAREMRHNPTEAEAALWRLLRAKRLAGWKFRQQQRIDRYIVDFICFRARLIVEADGAQHIDSDYDVVRDAYLHAQGFRLLRFYNNDILAQPDAVLTSILNALESGATGIEPVPPLTPLPDPPPQGGRELDDKDLPSG